MNTPIQKIWTHAQTALDNHKERSQHTAEATQGKVASKQWQSFWLQTPHSRGLPVASPYTPYEFYQYPTDYVERHIPRDLPEKVVEGGRFVRYLSHFLCARRTFNSHNRQLDGVGKVMKMAAHRILNVSNATIRGRIKWSQRKFKWGSNAKECQENKWARRSAV